ncbi:MAG: hypothetical protein HN509_11075 [Halobacteriovoraceae bacterium]|nr:hypothetical protein [Halobacteriovoraceae bacterium]MBT5092728.1 hypothetical protein [Halobacteriovoraceae bacterium]
MQHLLSKIPFLIELFVNGSFILLYSLRSTSYLPKSWSLEWVAGLLEAGAFFVPLVLFLVVIVNYMNSHGFEEFLRKYVFSIIVFVPLLITWGDLEFTFWLSSAHLLSSVLSLYDDNEEQSYDEDFKEKSQFFHGIINRPHQMVLFSFTGVILLGTFLLLLPVSSIDGKGMTFSDALFMATSATCVTGLSTLSIATKFSLFGQMVILFLIQIGGLSIMTLYSLSAILLGKSMGLKDRITMQGLLDVSSLEDLFIIIVDIVKYTFLIELWGGIVLTIGFTFEGFEFGQALYYGFFHAISAFCNAGFSLFETSLESYATKPLINGTIVILVFLGGLGFIVMKEIQEVVRSGKSIVRLGLHTKVVVTTTVLLTITGFLFIFFGEFLNALDHFTLFEKFQVALFQSVTLRTAGFNTIPLTNLNNYTLYAMTLFMFIGGSPGSTAGGIKSTTLAILVQSIKSTLKSEKDVIVFGRKIPGQLVVRATALTFISILFTSFFILVMMKLEPEQEFLPLFFEVISAGGTVGLSLGITPQLTLMGKFAISALMLVGRIGPLTLMLAIGQKSMGSGKIDYPDGRIMIG